MKLSTNLSAQESSELRAGKKEVFLLIHGYCDSPVTYKYLIDELKKHDYDYYALMLPGHGTTPEDLSNKTWEDWYHKVEKSYLHLKTKYKIVWVIGFSTGGTLSLYLAQSYPLEGIVLIAPFLRCPGILGMEPERLLYSFHSIFKNIKYFKKFFPAGIGDKKLRKEFVEYRCLPISTTISLFDLAGKTRKKLNAIQSPVLILHGIHDRTADPGMSKVLFDSIASQDKKLVYFQHSQHVLIMDKEKDKVISEILASITRWKMKNENKDIAN